MSICDSEKKLSNFEKNHFFNSLAESIRIRSVQEPPARCAPPCGPNVRKCLDHALAVSAGLGFRTTDLDHQMGWCEFGEGDEMIAVLGHLDVVPERGRMDLRSVPMSVPQPTSALKNNILYAMIFVMLRRCDFRKLGKLGPRMICIFHGLVPSATRHRILRSSPLFANALGGADKTWGATAALYASWVGGSANMAAMEDALPVDSGAYSCALALDTACYSLWIALLLFAVKYAQKWNKACKADTSKLDAVAAAANEEVAKETNVKPNAADWIFLIGLTLVVSAVSQYIGVQMNGFSRVSDFPSLIKVPARPYL
ncbi:MAG: DUF819 family protein [Pilosibacter sp.]